MSGGGMTFNLQLHEFDLAAALTGRGGGNEDGDNSRRRLLSNVSHFLFFACIPFFFYICPRNPNVLFAFPTTALSTESPAC